MSLCWGERQSISLWSSEGPSLSWAKRHDTASLSLRRISVFFLPNDLPIPVAIFDASSSRCYCYWHQSVSQLLSTFSQLASILNFISAQQMVQGGIKTSSEWLGRIFSRLGRFGPLWAASYPPKFRPTTSPINHRKAIHHFYSGFVSLSKLYSNNFSTMNYFNAHVLMNYCSLRHSSWRGIARGWTRMLRRILFSSQLKRTFDAGLFWEASALDQARSIIHLVLACKWNDDVNWTEKKYL